jgi:hypothetical protein
MNSPRVANNIVVIGPEVNSGFAAVLALAPVIRWCVSQVLPLAAEQPFYHREKRCAGGFRK